MNRQHAFSISFCILVITAFALAQCGPPPATPRAAYEGPCTGGQSLAFNIDKAAESSFGVTFSDEAPAKLTGLGMETAQKMADELQPGGTICSLSVSAATQAIIAEANRQAESGKRAEALKLLSQHLRRLTATAGAVHLVKLSAQDQNWRQDARDILGMGEVAYDLGGDPTPFHDAAQSLVSQHGQQELMEASLLDALRIEADAQLFGLEDLAQQARERIDGIATEMIDTAIEDFDPCSADRRAVVDLLNTEAQATLLGVDGLEPGEGRYEAVKAKIQQALSHQWNAYVREKGLSETLLEPVPPCNVTGELDINIFSVCSQNWASVGKVPFTVEQRDQEVEFEGTGHIAYNERGVIGGELDCSISVDAEVTLSGKFLEEAGALKVEFIPSFSSDGHYLIVGRTTPIHNEGVYPFNSFGSFVMPWVDGSTFPPFENTAIQYVLHLNASQ